MPKRQREKEEVEEEISEEETDHLAPRPTDYISPSQMPLPWSNHEQNAVLVERAQQLNLAKHSMLLTIYGVRSFWATASSEARTLNKRVAAERTIPYFLAWFWFRNLLI